MFRQTKTVVCRVLLLVCCAALSAAADDRPPNVLFLAVDDLNDFVGCLGGHPQAKTPNIDRLASTGVLFEQAYCAAPLCHPSRTAILTGLRPSTTGIYGNLNWFRDMPQLSQWVTLPQYFRKHGYEAVTGGKIFHQAHGKWSDPASWDQQYTTKSGTQWPKPSKRYQHGMHDEFENKILARLIDWAPLDVAKEDTADWKTAEGAAAYLKQDHDKPFFLACGIYRPHLSWYAPSDFFDMHPLDKVTLPPHLEADLEDVPERGRIMAGDEFQTIKSHGHWKSAVQGYLASTSFADACVGVVLDALASSQYRDNTIVVLWGDHGYHLGQKNHIAKSALWQPATRSPLIIRVPGLEENQRCSHPVSMIDLYPTLVDLCGLPLREGLDGRSIAPIVRDPKADWPYPALITHSPHWHGTNHAVRSKRYHYIRYSDGGEELYDMQNDPNQWRNLASLPEFVTTKKELARWLPKSNAPHFRGENK